MGDGMADQSNWRRRVRMDIAVVTDEVKAKFLEALAEHGRKYHGAKEAGVSYRSVHRAAENDPEFSEAIDEALGHYADKVKARQQHLVFNDEVTTQFGKDGKPVSENKRAYEKSVHKELEATSPADYRPGHNVELTHKNTGVLVVGAETSLEEFAQELHEANEKALPPVDALDELESPKD